MTTNSVAAAAAPDATTVAGPMSGGVEALVSATDSSTVDAGVKSALVDTVTLQGKVQDSAKANPSQGNSTIGGRIGSVLFVYNWKGNLRVRFMDSKNNLVYQTPPVMLARTADIMMRFGGSSVNATV
jgi:hypothetical protein